jgi:hypothetical protein
MPAAETKSNPIADSVATTTGRITEFNERAAANGRKAGAAYLDSYEKSVLSLVDSYQKTAEATKVDWLSTLASAQADFTREVTKAYTGAARELVS